MNYIKKTFVIITILNIQLVNGIDLGKIKKLELKNNDMATGINEFMASLIPPYDSLKTTRLYGGRQYRYFTNIPTIGVYLGRQGYPMRERLVFIQLDPKDANKILPSSIKQALKKQNISLSDLSVKNTWLSITVTKQAWHTAGKSTFNVVLHPWVFGWKEKEFKDPSQAIDFNVRPLVGLFQANGVKKAAKNSIPFNQFNPIAVIAHDSGVALSPNNARFTIVPNHDISTFWTLAISPNKQNLMITFNVLLNTQKAIDIFDQAIQGRTVKDFITELEKEKTQLPQVSEKAIDSIITIIKNEQPPLIDEREKEPVEKDNEEEKVERNQLIEALSNLSGNLIKLANTF